LATVDYSAVSLVAFVGFGTLCAAMKKAGSATSLNAKTGDRLEVCNPKPISCLTDIFLHLNFCTWPNNPALEHQAPSDKDSRKNGIYPVKTAGPCDS